MSPASPAPQAVASAPCPLGEFRFGSRPGARVWSWLGLDRSRWGGRAAVAAGQSRAQSTAPGQLQAVRVLGEGGAVEST